MNLIEEKLKKQLKIEQDSISLYDNFINNIADKEIRNKIIKIRNDEVEHEQLVRDTLKLLDGQKPKIIEKKKSKLPFLNGFADKFNSIFVVTGIDKYPNTVTNIINDLGIDCIYISFNKLPKYTKALLKDHGINVDKIKFVTCVKSQNKEYTFIDPESLTDLAILLEELVEKVKDKIYIFVDTISSFSIYHSTEIISKFVSSINLKTEEHNIGVVWLAISNESEKGFDIKISQLCDKRIEL
ncbi:ferritin-like domain-containing protein [Candidatus Woesearchaeota archaeon]|nr:ferritin-like domain-containing protein [Candidatus Woesearchaeota archaeon]